SLQRRPSGVTVRLVTAGRWTVTMSGGKHPAKVGDLFLALPGVPIEFRHDAPAETWEWHELQFSGEAATRFVQEFGLSEARPVATPRNPAAARRIFQRLHRLLGSPERQPAAVIAWVFRLIQACGRAAPAAAEPDPARHLVARAMTLLETAPANPWNVNAFAGRLGVDRTTLGRAFRRVTGKGPHACLDHYRLGQAKELLKHTDHSVAETAQAVGMGDAKYFISWFKKKAGAPPARWRRRHLRNAAGRETQTRTYTDARTPAREGGQAPPIPSAGVRVCTV
ncbi:MAG: AraC family transcriptional regulator, partial [Lentisphaeria bacterium]